MSPDAIREVLAHYVAGNPAESISFGATVTIVCTTEVAAHRWRTYCPDGVLPRSLTPVQVVEMRQVAMVLPDGAAPGYCLPSLGEPCGNCHRCAIGTEGDR